MSSRKKGAQVGREADAGAADAASYTDGLADGLKLAVQYLAAIWGDHPDCGPAWKPS